MRSSHETRASWPGSQPPPAPTHIATHKAGDQEIDAITYSAARANLAGIMERISNDHEALSITRNGKQAVVMLSLEDFRALEETADLLRNPANAERLITAVAQLSAGGSRERTLSNRS